MKDVAGSVLGNASANQASNNNAQRTPPLMMDEYSTQQSSGTSPIQGAPSKKSAFCSNCGVKINDGAKFCQNCGASVSGNGQPTPSAKTDAGTYTSRVQEFAGRIIKCPNCGQPISNTDVVCPACGHQVTDRAASSSVQRLVSELMAIENSRRQKNALDDLVQSFTGKGSEEAAISSKKVTLIKNFPIPNTCICTGDENKGCPEGNSVPPGRRFPKEGSAILGTRFSLGKSSVLYLCSRLTSERGWLRHLLCGKIAAGRHSPAAVGQTDFVIVVLPQMQDFESQNLSGRRREQRYI